MQSLIDNTIDCFHNFIFSNNFYVCNQCGLVLDDTNIETTSFFNYDSQNPQNQIMPKKSTKIMLQQHNSNYKLNRRNYILRKTEILYDSDKYDKFIDLLKNNFCEQVYFMYNNKVKFCHYVNQKAKLAFESIQSSHRITIKQFLKLTDDYKIRFDKAVIYNCNKKKTTIRHQCANALQVLHNNYTFTITNPFRLIDIIEKNVLYLTKYTSTIQTEILIYALLIRIISIKNKSILTVASEISTQLFEPTSIICYFRYCVRISAKIKSLRNAFKSCVIQ